MKTILLSLPLLLLSCSTPEQNARLSSIVNLALTVAERRGAITSADAQDVRSAETIILAPTQIETTSGK